MKKIFIRATLIFVVSVFSALLVAAQSSPGELSLDSGVTPHAKIDGIYHQFSVGYRNLDAAAVANLYAETAAYLSPGNNVETGRPKILENFKGFFDSVRKGNGKLEISFRILQRQVDTNLAYDVGIYTLISTNDKGESRRGSGKFVVVAKRGKDDVWHFQVDGYSDLPKQPE